MSYIVPAVLPTSRKDLEEKLALLAKIPGVKRVQIDVVDSQIASRASWPYTAIEEFKAMVEKREMLPYLDRFEYEIDLMCTDAEEAAGSWLTLGASRLTFHIQQDINTAEFLNRVSHRYGSDNDATTWVVSLGLAVELSSDMSIVEPCGGDIKYLQCMGIATIGRQGQPFDARVIEHVKMLHAKCPDVPIQVDGGVSLTNGKSLLAAGASSLVVGSAILQASDPAAAYAALEELQSPFGV